MRLRFCVLLAAFVSFWALLGDLWTLLGASCVLCRCCEVLCVFFRGCEVLAVFFRDLLCTSCALLLVSGAFGCFLCSGVVFCQIVSKLFILILHLVIYFFILF